MRNIALVLLLAAIMTVSACSSGGNSGDTASIRDVFIGGTQGLKISFIENSPPAEVTDKPSETEGFKFDASVTVENAGEHDIQQEGAIVTLSGFFPSDFGITANAATELKQTKPTTGVFRGVSKDPEGNKIPGDIDQVTFPASAPAKQFEYSKKLAGNQQFPFRAEVCYPYKTRALSQLCIMNDFTDTERPICNPSGSKQVSNSGAPVHVTSVSQSVGGRNKVLLNFEVQNVGTSDLFKPDPANPCKDDFSHKDRVQVTVSTELAGQESSLNCLGLLGGKSVASGTYSGEVLLSNGKASFTCIQTLGVADRVDSIKTYEVALNYQARDSVTTNVLVKHLI